ncbi:hypothetical protein BCON_0303g00020 [Botryotinia convoluta]|uniref:Exocyst complex component Sec8 n=1 Tax=Botryotinia convoluta TaxID=54673 RepID=A0A4Z1HD78_9HELO|nr:hypothetical protein BCON_0303g00020 [Botryotinia convoluta]
MSGRGYGGLGGDPYMNGNSTGYANGNGYGNGSWNGNGNANTNASAYPGQITEDGDYDPYGSGIDRYATPPPIPEGLRTPSPSMPRTPRSRGLSRPREPAGRPKLEETNAEKQIGEVLEHIKTEWPALCQNECVPVQLALQLLDTSSVGKAHEYAQFQQSMQYLQDSLKNIVHEHHQGFNSSIGTFHKIQTSIQTSQKRVRTLKDSLAQSKANLSTTDPELRKLGAASTTYDELLHTLSEVEELRLVPDQLEARISEKRFLTAVDALQDALRRIRSPELDDIGALSELRTYLANQETALTDILIEELHDHLYLKSPYCQERWQMLAKTQGGVAKEKFESSITVRPFFEVLDTMDLAEPMVEDASRNPEADTFYYVELLTEALNKLGRLDIAVNTIKQRLPVELFGIVNETNSEVDQKHPSSLRGGLASTQGNQTFSSRENTIRTDVIYDLLWTLYAKLEAIAEGHRVFHDVVKAITKREGMRNSVILLGGFRELWNLYQNEIRSLLHNYVTTDADVYQFDSPRPGASKSSKLEKLFRFSDADAKSVSMTTEYDDLENIIRAAVPGLMSSSRKSGADSKKAKSFLENSVGRNGTKRLTGSAFDAKTGGMGTHKSLVEPSVFNMSLLLPPTLSFLQRLKAIVPPGSDLVTSTLTSFLDNFLVNVFLPQLDETLGKLSDSVFEETDAFQQDAQWARVSRRPVFKGTAAFFTLITAFCRMLDTIPHDQALSQLIITQMMRYYDRCYDWFKSLVSRVRDSEGSTLKLSALLASEPGDIHDTMQKIWTSEEVDYQLLDKETGLLILQTNENPLEADDLISDRETISSLCVLYTSMKWLAIKIGQLRHITRNDADSSRTPSMQKPPHRRWTLLNDPARAQDEQVVVYLPMTQETVVAFDSIVSSFQELAATVLLTLHMETRIQILHSLARVLSPSSGSNTYPYILSQPVSDPDPTILSLNADLVAYDETIVKFLREKEINFVRKGLGLLIDTFMVDNAPKIQRINKEGGKRMRLNVLVLQQNLKGVEDGVGLIRSGRYWGLFEEGPDGIVGWAKEKGGANAGNANGDGEGEDQEVKFTYDELKGLVELCFSEQLGSNERGITTVAKRGMGECMLQLSEHMWQS